MKNILLCCNSMGIGGVETVILNQIVAFSNKGHRVFVIAKKGEYSSKVNEFGGEFIELEFPEENKIDTQRAEKIINIIREKKINEIHIHKYQCIPSVLVAALATQTPYFAYEHGIIDSKEYYLWHYPIYKSLFPIYYKNAYKIIAITPRVVEDMKKRYDLKEDKYVIIHNGIDFKTYKNDNPNYNEDIKQALIVSRIDKEKTPTIYNGIDAFIEIKKIYPKVNLNIVGGGNAEEDLIDYLNKKGLKYTYSGEKQKNEEQRIKLLGKQLDVKKFLKNCDIFLGVDRCALEAIAMKVPVIITGYNGINGLVTKENMNMAMEENFSGLNMNSINNEILKKQLIKLKNNRENIVNEVYNVAVENLNCFENYITIPDNEKLSIDWTSIFEKIEENSNLIEDQLKQIKAQYEWIQKVEEKNKELIKENQKLLLEKNSILEKNKKALKTKDEEIDMKKQEIKEIYNSKRWRYVEKLTNLFHKKK